MQSKGFNSILLDFFSIVDVELSLINFISSEYKHSKLKFFNLDKLNDIRDSNDLIKARTNNELGLFESIFVNTTDKDIHDIMMKLYYDHESIILEKYAITTNMKILIRAYQLAGSGAIKTTVRCDNDIQKRFIQTIGNVSTIICEREKVDMDNYGRLIIGYYKDALQYECESPKSILILDYRENFQKEDNTLLQPELIINLGDIHSIKIAWAYGKYTDLSNAMD